MSHSPTQQDLPPAPTAGDTPAMKYGERQIAEWLTAHGIAYRYDAKFRIIGEFQIRPDFYLPELDVYIEYWGMDTADYKIGMTNFIINGPRVPAAFLHE